jgi:antitoxin CptB|tara:strand:- start:6378 stop:6644 length:267 start_codon:yes stop_codon:yes gene_type:complete
MTESNLELSKIKWRCRRGTKELDFLLLSYFNERYLEADKEDKNAFLRLLELQDPLLIEFFAEPKKIQDPGIQSIILNILGNDRGYQIK